MEVCDQAVQYLEFIARIDEDFCPSAAFFKLSIFICCGFYRSAACRSDADYPVSALFCAVDLLCLRCLDPVKFRMHMVIQNVVCLYRTEGSKPDMKCYMCDLHSFCLDFFQKLRCKMKSCRRSSRRSGMFCIHGLVTVLVLQLMGNIRRKRHLSKLVQNLFKDSFVFEMDQTVSFLYDLQNFPFQKTVPEADSCSGFHLLSWFYKCFPDIIFFSF